MSCRNSVKYLCFLPPCKASVVGIVTYKFNLMISIWRGIFCFPWMKYCDCDVVDLEPCSTVSISLGKVFDKCSECLQTLIYICPCTKFMSHYLWSRFLLTRNVANSLILMQVIIRTVMHLNWGRKILRQKRSRVRPKQWCLRSTEDAKKGRPKKWQLAPDAVNFGNWLPLLFLITQPCNAHVTDKSPLFLLKATPIPKSYYQYFPQALSCQHPLFILKFLVYISFSHT